MVVAARCSGATDPQSDPEVVVVDAALMAFDVINCHPLVNTATTGVSQPGLRALFAAAGVVPLVVDFVAMTVIGGEA